MGVSPWIIIFLLSVIVLVFVASADTNARHCWPQWDCRRLSSFGLSGTLSGDIQSLSELQYLDLSYNKNLRGPLPSTIGTLSKLQNLILVGCSFTGEIPKEIGQLSNLIFL
uniref:Receptor protein kinase n=2 Tax=Oryza sativa subsp. japonica TaxID=39947 RepID=A0A5S6RC86_ORYSJ|nr:Putative receptor protein kinase [Oryza sativa]AAP52105.1 leucine-rich repeat family protein, putative [Oryza sativa Japonica Group]